jgi:hypothetical protein
VAHAMSMFMLTSMPMFMSMFMSMQAPLESIKGTVNALAPCVDLSLVYGGLGTPAPYNLRYGLGNQRIVLVGLSHQGAAAA